MSHRHIREDNKTTNGSNNLPVVSKCLAIVLISKSQGNSKAKSRFNLDSDEADNTVVDVTDGNVIVQSSEVQKAISPNGYNGKELLQDFKLRNKTCYWNPSLVESIKSLEYKGFVEPSTILVTGADIHLENLRSAWGRRVLKSPAGFDIERIGDVNGIQMQVIPQTQFMPLPDALCSIVMDLNTQRVMATWDTIVEKLAVWYRDMTMPDRQLIFDTLSGLIKDRKVFHTGSGYFVVTPDTNRLPNGNSSNFLPTNASWLPYHPMYVPVFQGQVGPMTPPQMGTPHGLPMMPPSRSHMRSISCQVTTIEESESEEGDSDVKVRSTGLSRESRCQSLKRSKNPKKVRQGQGEVDVDQGPLKRSSSLKHKSEKEKAKRDATPDPFVSKHEVKKSKGDKPSLFSKIFGRNKKKSSEPSSTALMPPPPPPPPVRSRAPLSSARSDGLSDGRELKEKEYATFSAQFPPPEWTWYQQQLEKQSRVETWVSQHGPSVPKHQFPTKNFAHPQPSNPYAHGIMNDYTPHHNQPTRKSVNSLYNQHAEYLPMSNATGNHYNKSQWPVSVNGKHHHEHVEKPQSIRPDNFYESFQNQPPDPVHHRKSKSKRQTKGETARHPSSHYHHQSSRFDVDKRQSVYDFIDQVDVTPLHASNVYNSVSGLSPVGHLSDESTYAKLAEHGPLHSTPCYTTNPIRARTERMSYGVDGHEARDRIYGPPDDQLRRKSHRSRRRGHKAYSYYGQGDDISYEYKGRLLNKNSSRAQSRDSGVNCVGLSGTGNHGRKRGGHLYENTPNNNKAYHNHNQHLAKTSNPSHAADSHARLDFNNATLGVNGVVDVNEVTDPAFSSVVFGIHSLVDQHGHSELGGPEGKRNDSEMANTISGLTSDFSQVPPPHTSLQSAFYEDSSLHPALLGANLVMCEAEINPKAPDNTQELTCESELIDVENLPDIREVAGSSDEVVEAVTDKVSAISVTDCVETCDKEDRNSIEGANEKDSKVDNGDSERIAGNGDTNDKESASKPHDKNSNKPLLKTETVVADSGFSSPRNLDGQASSQSQYSENSGSHSQTENSDAQQHSEEITVSDSHNTHSDINMASSEHNSGSTNENADLSAEDSSSKKFSVHHKTKSKGSSQSLKSVGSGSSKHSHNQQLYHKPHYSSTAKIITHPDVYNNNTMAFSGQEPHPASHSYMIHNQRLEPRKYKREKQHRMDIMNLPTGVPNHQYEEEQLSKKFGANGEYEVMGFL